MEMGIVIMLMGLLVGVVGLLFGIPYEIRQSELRLMDYIDQKVR